LFHIGTDGVANLSIRSLENTSFPQPKTPSPQVVDSDFGSL
jgi:hypothetical protein